MLRMLHPRSWAQHPMKLDVGRFGPRLFLFEQFFFQHPIQHPAKHPANIPPGWPLVAGIMKQPFMDTRSAPSQHPTPICNILLHFGRICKILPPTSCQHPTKLSAGVCRWLGGPPTSHQHPINVLQFSIGRSNILLTS